MTGSYECSAEGSAGFRPALNETLSALLSIRLPLQTAGGEVANEEGAVRCQQVGAQALGQIRLHRFCVRTLRAGAHRAVRDRRIRWHRHLLQLDGQVVPLHERQRRLLGSRYCSLRCRGRGARGAEENGEECDCIGEDCVPGHEASARADRRAANEVGEGTQAERAYEATLGRPSVSRS
jgi:hypothetical protein